jgi:hypothetical protein
MTLFEDLKEKTFYMNQGQVILFVTEKTNNFVSFITAEPHMTLKHPPDFKIYEGSDTRQTWDKDEPKYSHNVYKLDKELESQFIKMVFNPFFFI